MDRIDGPTGHFHRMNSLVQLALDGHLSFPHYDDKTGKTFDRVADIASFRDLMAKVDATAGPPLKVLQYPDNLEFGSKPVLRKKCKPVTEFNADLQLLAARMMTTTKLFRGVGLAAPQVGRSIRMITMCHVCPDRVMVNPEIIDQSDQVGMVVEGCLSLHGVQIEVRRPKRVKVKWFDVDGKEHKTKMGKDESRAVQHEIDHLNGKLIIDYPDDTDEWESWLERRARNGYEDTQDQFMNRIGRQSSGGL
jgi:peptide deformylase